MIPDAVSYGLTILQMDPSAGSPAGGDSVKLVGYGFEGSNVQVTIGGKQVTNLQVRPAFSGQFFPTEWITFTTPSGVPGYADVVVTTVGGQATMEGGFQYADSVQVYPITGALDAILYDRSRQLLYISNQDHNRIEVFDLNTSRYLSPIPVGNQPTSLALTPDYARLGVINSADATMSVIDPGAAQVLMTFTVVPPQNPDCNVPINMSSVVPHRMLLNLACPGTHDGGVFHLVNLDSASLSCTGVAGCQPNGTDMSFGDCCGLGANASTPDGTKVFLASEGQGTVALLDLTANTVTNGYQGVFNDAATDADGNIFASSFGIASRQLVRLSIMAYEPYADVGNQSLKNVTGEKLSPSGSLLFVPQTTGITIFDVHTGRLVQNIAVADGIPADMNALALDESGTKLFVISNSGITVAKLSQMPLSLATVNPTSGPAGTVVTLRGSGFENATSVTLGSLQGSVTYVDENTLTVVIPALPKGSLRVKLTNPGGRTYTLDDAFTVK